MTTFGLAAALDLAITISFDRPRPALFRYALSSTYQSDTHLPLLLGHTKIESTVRYLGIEVDDALAIAEQVDV
jgi:hypothetical protein